MAQWYYGSQAGQTGPVEDHEIRALIAAGSIVPETLVWRDGMKDWMPLSSVPELGVHSVAPYGPQYPAQPAYYMPPVAPNSGVAIASMVCGIVSFCLCYFAVILSIPAVICGHLALSQIKNSPMPMAGRGMAIAGLVLGYIGITITLGVILFFGFAFAANLP